MNCRKGFTLIEMLVVVVVIAILAGIAFRMSGIAGSKAAEAATRATLNQLANAINEFAAEYGHYPPVPDYGGGHQPLGYEYPPSKESGFDSTIAGNIANANLPWNTDDGRVFTFGLMSFLIPRYSGKASATYDNLLDTQQWNEQNETKGDIQRDLDAMKRWAPYLEGIVGGGPRGRKYGSVPYTNSVVTVLDGWDRGINYRSPPPYESYQLWSGGRGGGTSDDIYAELD